MSIKTKLLSKVSEPVPNSGNKITVVGCDPVGMAVAVACLVQSVSTEVALIDEPEEALFGVKRELQHGSLYINNAKIEASSDYSISAGSKLCIVTAGARRTNGETRLNLASHNIEILKHVIPALAEQCPDSVILIVSDPVDILTYVAWKLSKFPKNRIIGVGTSVDIARFCYFIGQRLGISPSAVGASIIGEHGDSSVPIWSGVNIAGVRLCDLNNAIGTPADPGKWVEIHQDVIKSGLDVIQLKGYTNWATAFCVVKICTAILQNTGEMLHISTCVNGEHGVKRDIFLSLPCLLGSQGVTHIVKQNLTDEERKQFLNSASVISKIIDTLKFDE